MKVAVLKLGSRISFNANDTSGGNGEARSIIKMLHQGGASVDIYTKILKKDTLLPEYTWHNLSTIPHVSAKADALIVLNGSVNFFGGAEDPEQLLNYALINDFEGPVFYILCDPELTFKQVWPSVSKKPWGSAWEESMLNVVRKDIVYIAQPVSVDKVLGTLKTNAIIPSDIVHFPFEQFPCLNEQLPFNPTPSVDLSYGGTMRGGKRIKKMVKFYFGHPEDVSVEMFGKIKREDFSDKIVNGLSTPLFTGPVRYDEMLPKMNQAMSTCIIGDPWYEQIDDMAQRAYESIWSSVITFIDADLDKMRRVYGRDRTLSDFLYVSDKAELTEKIQLLKTNPSLRHAIALDQIAAIDFDASRYCEGFVNQIESFCKSRK